LPNAANEAKLRVAGQPRITEKEGAPEGQVAFDAVFEVFPEVKIGDLAGAEVEKLSAEVTDAAIDKTMDILRKQRRSFAQRAQDAAAQDGDRVTVDFEGKIDGEPFAGGKAEDFQFLVGEGQMLKEFEDAVRGMKWARARPSPWPSPPTTTARTWPARRPTSWSRQEDRSRPPARSERATGQVAGHCRRHRRRPARRHQEEPGARSQVPPAGPQQAGRDGRAGGQGRAGPAQRQRAGRIERLIEGARADLKQRGIKDADKAESPKTCSAPGRAPRAPGPGGGRAGARQQLQAKPEQLKAHIDELAASYEKPEDVVRWYFGDRQRWPKSRPWSSRTT
jgi:trigger factor